MTDQTAAPMRVTVVHAPACHYCEEAESVLRDLAARWAIDVRVVELDSPEGARLVAAHRPAMTPLVLVGDAYFSSGRLPRTKLTALLERRGVPRAPVAAVAVPQSGR